jgi:tRNA nucleotidyltransferase (CCA-adding enzyme)
LVAIFFEKPEVLEDVLYTQGRKALKVLEKVLVRRGFRVLSSDVFVRKRICLLYELESLRSPRAKLHLGPKTNTFHEGRFLEKYRTYEGKLTEPFVSGERWAVYLRRRYSSAPELLQDYLSQGELERKGLPSHISKALDEGFEIKVDKAAFEREFLKDLGDFVDPRFPWEV